MLDGQLSEEMVTLKMLRDEAIAFILKVLKGLGI